MLVRSNSLMNQDQTELYTTGVCCLSNQIWSVFLSLLAIRDFIIIWGLYPNSPIKFGSRLLLRFQRSTEAASVVLNAWFLHVYTGEWKQWKKFCLWTWSSNNPAWRPVECSPGGDWPTGNTQQWNNGIKTVTDLGFLAGLLSSRAARALPRPVLW